MTKCKNNQIVEYRHYDEVEHPVLYSVIGCTIFVCVVIVAIWICDSFDLLEVQDNYIPAPNPVILPEECEPLIEQNTEVSDYRII